MYSKGFKKNILRYTYSYIKYLLLFTHKLLLQLNIYKYIYDILLIQLCLIQRSVKVVISDLHSSVSRTLLNFQI